MTAVEHDVRVQPGLLEWLDEHDVRYEVIDGMVVVSPPPGISHERWVMRVVRALDTAVTPGLEVLSSGLEVHYGHPSYVMPDVSVVRTVDADQDDRGMFVPPVLAVEVLSPSTRRKDLLLKRESRRPAALGWSSTSPTR